MARARRNGRADIDASGVYYDLMSAMDGWEKSWIPYREYDSVAEARKHASGYYAAHVEELARAYGVAASTIRKLGPGLSSTFDVISEKFKDYRSRRGTARTWGPPRTAAKTRRNTGGRGRKHTYLYVLQGHYAQGWEDIAAEAKKTSGTDLVALRAIRQTRKEYRDNEGGSYRIITRRELR